MKNKILNLLGLATRAGNIVAGNNACENALKMKKIKMLVISEEASEKTKKNYKFYAKHINKKIVSKQNYIRNSKKNALFLKCDFLRTIAKFFKNHT